MRNSIIILLFGLFISLTSCRTDFDTVPSTGGLEFSAKTVYLDTIFANIGSSTYQLKVYNRSDNDIRIPEIKLGKADSKYRITVDGMIGDKNRSFENVELLANDSLYIFIETTVNITETESDFTYNDKILFDVGSNQQSVDLVTLVRDVIFIKPNRDLDTKLYETISVNGFVDDEDKPLRGHTLVGDELVWKKDKPYVVYGNAVVPNGSTLIIEPGAQVYFHYGAALIVDNGAKIDIQGELNETDSEGNITNRREVTFEGDRLEPIYENVPGQWGTIFILSGSASGITNEIDYLTLKNATVGLFVLSNINNNTPNLVIKNSQIYDCSDFGILARTSNVTGSNLVINTAGQACLGATLGGSYDFTHCTFNNNWNSTTQVAILINDYFETKTEIYYSDLVKADFKNCIIYGNNNIELSIEKKLAEIFNPKFENCLVKFNEINTQLASNTYYNDVRNQQLGNIKNKDPKFQNLNRNILKIMEDSPAIGKSNPLYSTFSDIINHPRPTIGSTNSDIGAYQFIAE